MLWFIAFSDLHADWKPQLVFSAEAQALQDLYFSPVPLLSSNLFVTEFTIRTLKVLLLTITSFKCSRRILAQMCNINPFNLMQNIAEWMLSIIMTGAVRSRKLVVIINTT